MYLRDIGILKKMTLEIDELPKDKIHFEEHFTGDGDKSKNSHHTKHSFTYLETMLYCVTYRPVDGLTAEEIQEIVNFVLGCDRLLYYAIGVEVLGGNIKTRHLHINVVMKDMCRNEIVRDLFRPLMKDARLAPREDIALKVVTCKRNEVRNKTVLLHGAYALKDAAIDKPAHQITAEHWNNRTTTWTNIFDGKKDGGNEDWWKLKEDRFAHLLYDKFHDGHKSTVTLTRGNGNKLIRDYASKKNMEYTLDARPEIIAEMVMDTTGTVNFEQNILRGRLQEQVNGFKGEDCYKNKLTKKLRKYYASLDDSDDEGAGCASYVANTELKKLQVELSALRTKYTVDIDLLNRKRATLFRENVKLEASIKKLRENNVERERKRRKICENKTETCDNKTEDQKRQDDILELYKQLHD